MTNNSTKSRRQFTEERLVKYKYEDHSLDQIYTSGYVAAQYLKKHFNSQEFSVYVVGESGLKEELQVNGIKVINEIDDPNPEMTSDDLSTVELDPSVKAIVVGFNYTFSYRKLCMAILYLQLNNALFVQTNPDKYLKTVVQDRKLPGGGTIAKSIEVGSQVQPVLLGKPTRNMFNLLREEHSLEKEPLSKFLMIGDSLQTDITFGINCEIDTLLVLSGNTSEERALSLFENKDSSSLPTYVAPYFGSNLSNTQLTQ